MKSNIVYKDFNLTFDSKKNPILNTQDAIDDYDILRSIFLNKAVMSTSTLCCGQVPINDEDFHSIICGFLKEKHSTEYGLKKIYFNGELKGIGGLLEKSETLNNKKCYEIAGFMKEQFINKGYGIIAALDLINNFDYSKGFIISSVWKNFLSQNKFLIKNNFLFIREETKEYNNIKWSINIYTKTNNDKNILKEEVKKEEDFKFDLNKLDSFLITKNIY